MTQAPTIPYSRAQVEAVTWWLVTHPDEMALVAWLAGQDHTAATAAARRSLAERRRVERTVRRQRIHGCPMCRCLPQGGGGG